MTTRGMALMQSHHPIWQLGKKRNQIRMDILIIIHLIMAI